jgi:hypothetical protein
LKKNKNTNSFQFYPKKRELQIETGRLLEEIRYLNLYSRIFFSINQPTKQMYKSTREREKRWTVEIAFFFFDVHALECVFT